MALPRRARRYWRGSRPRRSRGWRRWIIVVLLGLAALPAAADYLNGLIKSEGECRVTRVVDGDTLAIACEGRLVDRLRLTGIDTPEVRGNCLDERMMAFRATWFTRWQLWTAEQIEVRLTGGLDRYGRALGLVVVDQEGLASRLLDAGLAIPYVPGDVNWCERIERGLI